MHILTCPMKRHFYTAAIQYVPKAWEGASSSSTYNNNNINNVPIENDDENW